MQAYTAGFVGPLILVLLGDGVVTGVLLQESKAENAGWVAISFGWGLGVAIAVYTVGAISSAHINPAVTVGLASIGVHPWVEVPGYIIAQLLDGFFGVVLVWLAYLPHYSRTEDPELKLATFCTIPEIRNFAANFLTELSPPPCWSLAWSLSSQTCEGWPRSARATCRRCILLVCFR